MPECINQQKFTDEEWVALGLGMPVEVNCNLCSSRFKFTNSQTDPFRLKGTKEVDETLPPIKVIITSGGGCIEKT